MKTNYKILTLMILGALTTNIEVLAARVQVRQLPKKLSSMQTSKIAKALVAPVPVQPSSWLLGTYPLAAKKAAAITSLLVGASHGVARGYINPKKDHKCNPCRGSCPRENLRRALKVARQ